VEEDQMSEGVHPDKIRQTMNSPKKVRKSNNMKPLPQDKGTFDVK